MFIKSPRLLFICLAHCLFRVFYFIQDGKANFGNLGCNGIIINSPEPNHIHKDATESNQNDERTRIFGGPGTLPEGGDHRHVVRIALIGDFKKPHCAGTIHNALYVITAAHCVQHVEPSELLVHVGQGALDKRAEQNRSVVLIQIHEDWDSLTFANDLALLKLNDSLILSGGSVLPVLLGEPNLPNTTESQSYITGWGLTYSTWGNKTFYPPIAGQVIASIIDLTICKDIYHKLGKQVNKNEMCAGGKIGYGPCNGDDGTSLSVRVTNEYKLVKVFVVGILSRYEPSCATGVPDIYLELDTYKSWIASNAGRSCDFNVYAHDNRRLLKNSYQHKLHKPKGIIDENLAKAICISFNQFLQTSTIKGPLKIPTTVQNYTKIKLYSCQNLQWNTCNECQKFEHVVCHHEHRELTEFMNTRQKTTRIVRGSDAQRNQYPYIVRISIDDDEYVSQTACNGVIYNSLYVITSSECVHSSMACQLTVIAGDHSVKNKDETEQVRRVVAIIMHENFERNNYFKNDIALLKLESPLNFTNCVYSAVLTTKEFPTNDVKSVELSGWGFYNSEHETKDVLQTVKIPFVDDCNCRLDYSYVDGSALNANKFCFGGDGIGLCNKEYGNPLTVTDAGITYVVGIASFASVCGYYPGVATKVSAYREWIALRAG